ncbi:glutaredoxin domain-containing protein [Halomonas sp. 86]|uniref:glutaredoxin domain-containing protein n=1 Tax=unclassified Halomonas TaxID=2609666 RepID=UPI00403362BC
MIKIYTTPNCPQCDATKRTLEKRGIEYRQMAFTDSVRDRFYADGHRQLPIVEAGSETWSGFRPDLIAALEVGR